MCPQATYVNNSNQYSHGYFIWWLQKKKKNLIVKESTSWCCTTFCKLRITIYNPTVILYQVHIHNFIFQPKVKFNNIPFKHAQFIILTANIDMSALYPMFCHQSRILLERPKCQVTLKSINNALEEFITE